MEFHFGKNYSERGETYCCAWNFTDRDNNEYLCPPKTFANRFQGLNVYASKNEDNRFANSFERPLSFANGNYVYTYTYAILEKDVDDYGDVFFTDGIRELQVNPTKLSQIYNGNIPERLYVKETWYERILVPKPPLARRIHRYVKATIVNTLLSIVERYSDGDYEEGYRMSKHLEWDKE